MPLMCRMTMELTNEGMTCNITPMDAASLGALKERCQAMMGMMAMGMPAMMACGGMPMMMMSSGEASH
ncbi:hypothetical protein [Anaeromyxobacter oryzisoli]|uniref:hypothetical protein n=1 Tax=Anaeromyxobacter oryzisoli TaxID=2925408 RepID=UPI001F56F67F|nr:hypothetical protein [Anaeromyxobacter sp. SG63]